MDLNHRFFAALATFFALVLGIVLMFGFFADDLDYLSRRERREHALTLLPKASMLQAADSCEPGHFKTDETYGYWAQDFQLLLQESSAVENFKQLTRHEALMAKLYGLAGLRLVDSGAFAIAFDATPRRDTLITVAEQCRWEDRPIGTVLEEIKSGHWSRALTKAPIDVH